MTETGSQNNIHLPQTYKAYPALRQQDADFARLLVVASPAFCQSQKPIHILRLPEVIARVGLCRASIYAHMTQGSFPKQITIGSRAVGWLEHEVDAWFAARMSARKLSPP